MSPKVSGVFDSLEYTVKRFSSWVAFVATAVGAWYTNMTPESQAAFVSAHPVLVPWAPYIAGAAFVLAALKKQDITTAGMRREAALDAFLDAIAAQKAAGTLPPFVVAPHGVDPEKVAALVTPPAPSRPEPPVLSTTDIVLDNLASVNAQQPLLTADQIRARLAAAPVHPTPERHAP